MMKVLTPIAGAMVVAAIAVTGFVLTRDNEDNGDGQLATGNTNSVATNTNTNTNTSTITIADMFGIHGALASPFTTYREVAVTINPQLQPYTIAQNLQNVENTSDFTFSDDAKELLVENAFVVQPATWNEFFSLYEQNRYDDYPSFVTTDSILHNYHLFFDNILKNLEEGELRNQLLSLNTASLAAAEAQYDELKGTAWGTAAQRNVAFFSVASKLLDDSVEVPAEVSTAVEEELALIAAHNTLDGSPIMELAGIPYLEDYSQYMPRGHYTKSETLKAYFRTMMWYGRMNFRFKFEDELRSAVLQTEVLSDDTVHDPWGVIYETTQFFVGNSDDIIYPDLQPVVEQVYGTDATLETIVNDTQKFTTLVTEAKKLRTPEINSMAVDENAEDRIAEILGFRFMGQRFTLDAAIFQKLICRDVGNKHGTEECGGSIPDSRMLPKALDIPAAMGSDAALGLLDEQGDTDYKNYNENMAEMRERTANLDTATWTQNLYWGWLYAIAPLTDTQPEGYPTFMRNSAWELRDLNTYLGSFTELKHDTILYAKQAYAELGGGSEHPAVYGYVEPQPYVYGRLASLTQMTSEGLELRGLLDVSTKENLALLRELTLSLKTISEKELAGETLTDDEYELIRSYGGQLEHFWLEANLSADRTEAVDVPSTLQQNPAALVADVATNPNGSVLEEAIGYINEIYVVVEVKGKLQITKGGVFSYYEFDQPLSDRLTDEAWRELLNSEQAPDQPSWTQAFTVSAE